jgi:hypothetical protein
VPEGKEVEEDTPYWSPDPVIREKQKYERRKQKPNHRRLVQVTSRRYYRKHRHDPAFLERKRLREQRWRGSPEYHSKSLTYRAILRGKLFEIYGIKCACCGESNRAFLTLDHVNNDGKEDRAKASGWATIYRRAIREQDKSKYQILCYNCNLGKSRNGGVCPHLAENRKLGDGITTRWIEKT